jgi:peptide/nickel transport system substrate-binding protein
MIERALKTGVSHPSAANDQWAQIDHALVDEAVWVPMVNPNRLDFVSKRVKGFLYSPQWTFLLDQASVK